MGPGAEAAPGAAPEVGQHSDEVEEKETNQHTQAEERGKSKAKVPETFVLSFLGHLYTTSPSWGQVAVS